MTIYITGDTHGQLNLDKLYALSFDVQGLTKDDYVIICGDLGLIWYEDGSESPIAQEYERRLDWLDSKSWTTLFIDGNHENHDRLASYPVEKWHGGRVHKIRPSVIHLMRGEMFDIDGKSFFCMGGAASIDRAQRIEGKSWWASEIPDEAEKAHAMETLDEHGWKCDVVLTHDCPTHVQYELGIRCGASYHADSWSEWLQFVADKLTFGHWFFGHYHQDMKHIGPGGKFTAIFQLIYDLDDGDWTERMIVDRPLFSDQLPPSAHDRGYTVAEIADIAGVDQKAVEKAMEHEMIGSTVAVSDDGDILIYPSDAMRVLCWC